VPTWNYVAVHVYGPVGFFDDSDRLLETVRRLTALHEGERASPWAVSDAPPDFVQRNFAELSACACQSRDSRESAR
jgi:transcriptional regulator